MVHPAEVVVRLQELGQLAGKVFRVGQQLLYLAWETTNSGSVHYLEYTIT